MSELREQQRAFAKRVFEGQGFDAQGAADKNHIPDVLALKHGAVGSFSDAQRFQIYHNNIFIGLRAALSGVYPVINKLVGDDFFQNVAREYIVRYPTSDGNVHEFGRAFPAFLGKFPGADDLQYLPDVARLEWAYHEIFHAQEAGVLNIQALASLDETASEHLRFHVSSSCRLLSSDYPLLKIWQANQQGSEDLAVDLDEGGVQLAVMRSGFDVVFRPLNKAVFALLDALSNNRLFADACAEAVAIDPDCDIGAILNDLIAQRLLAGFSCLPVETGN